MGRDSVEEVTHFRTGDLATIRNIAKRCAVRLLGHEIKPRRILYGLGSGYKIAVSPAENFSYLVGTAEPHLQKIIRKCVTEGDTVYDIGAHIGYVSLSLAKRVGPKGHVVAFEPLPGNIRALRENIAHNHLSNVQIFEAAASETHGQAVIRIAENPATASLIWHKNNQSARNITINTVAIDELIDSGSLIGNPKFVKVDVEGAEGLVLRGMRRMIAAAKPIVFLECSDSGRETTWQLFGQLNYRCESAITRQSVTEFSEYRHSDFLWLPAV